MYILISDETIKKDKVINMARQNYSAANMSRLSNISIARLAKLVNNKDIIKHLPIDEVESIDGTDYEVQIDLKISPVKNKFWMHMIYDIDSKNQPSSPKNGAMLNSPNRTTAGLSGIVTSPDKPVNIKMKSIPPSADLRTTSSPAHHPKSLPMLNPRLTADWLCRTSR